jgi:putative endonuclease
VKGVVVIFIRQGTAQNQPLAFNLLVVFLFFIEYLSSFEKVGELQIPLSREVGKSAKMGFFCMYYFYILFSVTADKFYVGFTDDPDRRISDQNNSLHNTFTSKFHSWKCFALFECGDSKENAILLERAIKKQKVRKFLRTLIDPAKPLYVEFDQLVRVLHMQD